MMFRWLPIWSLFNHIWKQHWRSSKANNFLHWSHPMWLSSKSNLGDPGNFLLISKISSFNYNLYTRFCLCLTCPQVLYTQVFKVLNAPMNLTRFNFIGSSPIGNLCLSPNVYQYIEAIMVQLLWLKFDVTVKCNNIFLFCSLSLHCLDTCFILTLVFFFHLILNLVVALGITTFTIEVVEPAIFNCVTLAVFAWRGKTHPIY